MEMSVFICLFLVGVGVYMFPWILAVCREHPQSPAIAVLNLLLGWTLLGWVGALVWACTAVAPTAPPSGQAVVPPPARVIAEEPWPWGPSVPGTSPLRTLALCGLLSLGLTAPAFADKAGWRMVGTHGRTALCLASLPACTLDGTCEAYAYLRGSSRSSGSPSVELRFGRRLGHAGGNSLWDAWAVRRTEAGAETVVTLGSLQAACVSLVVSPQPLTLTHAPKDRVLTEILCLSCEHPVPLRRLFFAKGMGSTLVTLPRDQLSGYPYHSMGVVVNSAAPADTTVLFFPGYAPGAAFPATGTGLRTCGAAPDLWVTSDPC